MPCRVSTRNEATSQNLDYTSVSPGEHTADRGPELSGTRASCPDEKPCTWFISIPLTPCDPTASLFPRTVLPYARVECRPVREEVMCAIPGFPKRQARVCCALCSCNFTRWKVVTMGSRALSSPLAVRNYITQGRRGWASQQTYIIPHRPPHSCCCNPHAHATTRHTRSPALPDRIPCFDLPRSIKRLHHHGLGTFCKSSPP
jgi:hypothetical protein